MRTLDTRSIITFTTRTMMLRGLRASFLSLLLQDNNYSIFEIKIIKRCKPNFDDGDGDSYEREKYGEGTGKGLNC